VQQPGAPSWSVLGVEEQNQLRDQFLADTDCRQDEKKNGYNDKDNNGDRE
jgi:hypothetical protein